MDRQSRLRANQDFQRVRREGRSWSSPLAVLIAAPNAADHTRFGFAVGKRIGNAVTRNRVKRRLREAERMQSLAVMAGLADATRHLEHGSMARLFVPGAAQDEALADYLRSFNLIVSYLYDPDGDTLIEDTTISGNDAGDLGGGIYLYDTDSGGAFVFHGVVAGAYTVEMVVPSGQTATTPSSERAEMSRSEAGRQTAW